MVLCFSHRSCLCIRKKNNFQILLVQCHYAISFYRNHFVLWHWILPKTRELLIFLVLLSRGVKKSLPRHNFCFSLDQHHEGFFSRSFDHNTVSDLQRVNKAITEKLSEKDVALKHQRNTNRYVFLVCSLWLWFCAWL